MAKRIDFSQKLEECIEPLIREWRHLMHESGPYDRLQTREFRGVCEKVRVWSELLSKREGDIASFLGEREGLASYLLYGWLLRYAESLALCGELSFLENPTVLEMGSWGAPFSIAAQRTIATQALALEMSQESLKVAGNLAGSFGQTLSFEQVSFEKIKYKQGLASQKYTILSLGYLLRDLYPSEVPDFVEERAHFVEKLFSSYVEEGGVIVVTDSSADLINKEMLLLRDALIERGFSIKAPCVWQGKCPQLKAKSVCYTQRPLEKPYLMKELQRGADIYLNSLKFSYLLIQKAKPAKIDKPFYRVVSPPLDQEGKKIFYLCGSDGKKTLESRVTQFTAKNKALNFLKKGEVVTFEDAHSFGDRWILDNESSCTIVAALNKPIFPEG